jgi:hypothetical protein
MINDTTYNSDFVRALRVFLLALQALQKGQKAASIAGTDEIIKLVTRHSTRS